MGCAPAPRVRGGVQRGGERAERGSEGLVHPAVPVRDGPTSADGSIPGVSLVVGGQVTTCVYDVVYCSAAGNKDVAVFREEGSGTLHRVMLLGDVV